MYILGGTKHFPILSCDFQDGFSGPGLFGHGCSFYFVLCFSDCITLVDLNTSFAGAGEGFSGNGGGGDLFVRDVCVYVLVGGGAKRLQSGGQAPERWQSPFCFLIFRAAKQPGLHK